VRRGRYKLFKDRCLTFSPPSVRPCRLLQPRALERNAGKTKVTPTLAGRRRPLIAKPQQFGGKPTDAPTSDKKIIRKEKEEDKDGLGAEWDILGSFPLGDARNQAPAHYKMATI